MREFYDHPSTAELEAQLGTLEAARRFFVNGESSKDGFQLAFDSDGEALNRALDFMGINHLINTGEIYIHNIIISNKGQVSHMGQAVKSVEGLPIADALAAMQAIEFTVRAADSEYSDLAELVSPKGPVVTKIIFGHRKLDENSRVCTDLTKPVMEVAMTQAYEPEFYDRRDLDKGYGVGGDLDAVQEMLTIFEDDRHARTDEYDADNLNVGEILGHVDAKSWEKQRRKLGVLAKILTDKDVTLAPPQPYYFVRVGRPYSDSIGLDLDGVHASRSFRMDLIKRSLSANV